MDVSVAVEVGMFAALVIFFSNVTTSTYVRAVTAGSPLIDPNFLASRSLLLLPEAAEGQGGFRVVPMRASVLDESKRREMEAIKKLSELNVSSLSSFDGDLNDTENSVSDSSSSSEGSSSGEDKRTSSFDLQVPPATVYLEVTGSLLFGALDLFEEALEAAAEAPDEHWALKCIILDLSHVSVVDASGLEVLEEQFEGLKKRNITLVLTGLSRQPLKMLARAGFLDHIGRKCVVRTLQEAVDKASELATARS